MTTTYSNISFLFYFRVINIGNLKILKGSMVLRAYLLDLKVYQLALMLLLSGVVMEKLISLKVKMKIIHSIKYICKYNI